MLRRVLSGLVRGSDVFELAALVADFHPRNQTFPGEVFMGLAVDALDLAGITGDHPLPYAGLRETYLPECEFRGRTNRKIQYAVLTSAAVRGGLEPDLLEEVSWWQADDYWRYALYGFVALIRAGADRLGIPVEELAGRLAAHHHVELT